MPRNDFRNGIKELRANHPVPTPIETTPRKIPKKGFESEEVPVSLPPILSAKEISNAKRKTPALLVKNLLHRGCKMSISGGSKSFKSWAMIDLGLSIATGKPWWGLECKKGRVLYINFELMGSFMRERIDAVCEAKNMGLPEDFLIWNLRSQCYSLPALTAALLERKDQLGDLDLIIIDPIYKALGDLDENSNSDINQLMKQIEDLGEVFDSTTVFGSHFAKGNSAQKSSKDRAAGAGVFSRDPDVLISLNAHEDDDHYVIESDLRYLPRIPPFVMKWEFPIMVPAEGKDPRRLKGLLPVKNDKKASPENDAFNSDQVFDCLPLEGCNDAYWRKLVIDALGSAGAAYYRCKQQLLDAKRIELRGHKFYPTRLSAG